MQTFSFSSKYLSTIFASALFGLIITSNLLRWRKNIPKGKRFLLPFIGSTLTVIADPIQHGNYLYENFKTKGKSVMAFHDIVFGVLRVYVITSSRELERMLIKESNTGFPDFWKYMMGEYSVAFVNGSMHKFLRGVILQSFTPNALQSYLPALRKNFYSTLTKDWVKSSQENPLIGREISRLITFLALEDTVLGLKPPPGGHQPNTPGRYQDFEEIVNGSTSVIPYELFGLTQFGKTMAARRRLLEEYQPLLEASKEKVNKPNAKAITMLDHAVKSVFDGQRMTDAQLLDFILIMQFAGVDTTMSSILNLILQMHLHPEYLSVMRAEIDLEWKSGDLDDLTFELLSSNDRIPNIRAFLYETWRFIPPAGLVSRSIKAPVQLDDTWDLEPGMNLAVPVSLFHSREENWGADASSFDPKKHWLDEQGYFTPVKDSRFLTFGYGSRQCVGQNFAKLEIMTWFTIFLRFLDFNVTRVNPTIQFPFHRADWEAYFKMREFTE